MEPDAANDARVQRRLAILEARSSRAEPLQTAVHFPIGHIIELGFRGVARELGPQFPVLECVTSVSLHPEYMVRALARGSCSITSVKGVRIPMQEEFRMFRRGTYDGPLVHITDVLFERYAREGPPLFMTHVYFTGTKP